MSQLSLANVEALAQESGVGKFESGCMTSYTYSVFSSPCIDGRRPIMYKTAAECVGADGGNYCNAGYSLCGNNCAGPISESTIQTLRCR